MNTAICAAIQKRLIIRLHYKGGSRIVQPYIHGTSLAGNEVLSAFQMAGHSTSGVPMGWKLFDLARVSDVQHTTVVFPENRLDYNPDDPQIAAFHCRVP